MLTTKNRVRKNLSIFLTAVTVLAGCTPRGPRLLLEGERLIQEGKYPLAIEKLTAATSLMSTNALAWNYLGLACQHAGQPLEAEKAYLRALQLNRDLTEVRYNLGCLWLEQNKLEAAKSELLAYTLRRGNSAEGLLKLGSAQLRLRELNGAEKSFADGLKIDARNPELLNGMGLVRLQRGRPTEAVQYFNAALKAHTNHPAALLNLAVVSHLYLKDKPAALLRYRECLALKPPPANAEGLSAIVSQLEQELRPPAVPRATNIITQVITNPPAPTNIVASKPAPTNTVPPLNPPSTSPKVLSSPKTEPAITTVKTPTPQVSSPAARPSTASAPLPKPPPAVVNTAQPPAKVEVVNLPPEPVLKPASDTVPQPAGAFSSPVVVTSSVPRDLGATKPAKRGFLKSLNPLNLLHSDSKTPSRLTPVPATAPQAQPEPEQPATPPPPTFARYKYRSPVKPAPGNRASAHPLFLQGVEAQQRQRWAEAMQAYRTAIRTDPAFFEAHYNLGLACTRGGELPSALVAYETALALQPDSLDARYNFALALKQANYVTDAVAEFEKSLARYPNEVRVHLALANACDQQLRRPAKAREHYAKVLELEPGHPQADNIRYWMALNP